LSSPTPAPLPSTLFPYTTLFRSVLVLGGSLTYQWRRDGLDIPGATNSTLVLSNLLPADAGSYTLVVINPSTTLFSNPAQLTVRRSEEHTSELQSQSNLVCRLLLE